MRNKRRLTAPATLLSIFRRRRLARLTAFSAALIAAIAHP